MGQQSLRVLPMLWQCRKKLSGSQNCLIRTSLSYESLKYLHRYKRELSSEKVIALDCHSIVHSLSLPVVVRPIASRRVHVLADFDPSSGGLVDEGPLHARRGPRTVDRLPLARRVEAAVQLDGDPHLLALAGDVRAVEGDEPEAEVARSLARSRRTVEAVTQTLEQQFFVNSFRGSSG